MKAVMTGFLLLPLCVFGCASEKEIPIVGVQLEASSDLNALTVSAGDEMYVAAFRKKPGIYLFPEGRYIPVFDPEKTAVLPDRITPDEIFLRVIIGRGRGVFFHPEKKYFIVYPEK